MKYTMLPFKGYQSLKALNAFNALLLGLKMLPAYAGIDYPTFFESFKEKSEAETELLLREAVAFVHLETSEIDALISFAADENGIAMGKENIKNLAPEELFEIIVQVAIRFSEIKITLVSEEEKKKIRNFSIDLRGMFSKHPESELGEILNLAFYGALHDHRSFEVGSAD